MVNDYNYDPNKFITFKKVEEIWATNKKPVVVYLNNPFCQGKDGKNCKFCVHRGIVGETKETVKDFYFNYMPKQFKQYENILNSQELVMVAFGGGTPNYLTAKEFDDYLNLLPQKLKDLPKQIELHSAFVTKEYLDVLAKHNFKIVTFCIQTFDKEILDKWNRLPPKSNTIELMQYTHKLGMFTAVDLITYWNKSEDDISILFEDLEKLKGAEPDEITVSVLYQNKNEDLDKIKRIYKLIRTSMIINFDYINLEESDTKNFNIAPTRYYNSNNKECIKLYGTYIDSLTAIEWDSERKVSTLGIGCFKNQIHDVYSVIGGYKTIYEIYDGNEVKYYLAKDYNFWDECHKLVEKLRKEIGEEIPLGSELIIKNIIQNTGYFFGNFEQGHLNWNIKTDDYDFIDKVSQKINKESNRTDFDILHET